jgi:NAD-dependent dihydropyrimidine dehydrogenase PreA subunit
VLTLNKSYVAINVQSVKRSISAVCKGNAKVLDAQYQQHDWDSWLEQEPGEEHILAVRGREFVKIAIPEIIIATSFNELPSSKVTFCRRNIFKRDKYTCQYCHKQPPRDELTLDHVIPRSLGGVSSFDNCVLACLSCNAKKANRTPEQAGMKLKKKPIRPQWKPLYSTHHRMPKSWGTYIKQAYWDVELEP